MLHPSEISELFSRRDIAELELTLRTSADPNEKITALRRLALSPASDREKLALFAHALTDRAAEVRGEAAEALTSLGLAPDVAEDARALAEGNPAQKRFAAQRIGRRILGADDTEMGVLLRIIAGTLRHETAVDVRRLLLGAIEGACEPIARDAASTRDLVRILVGQLRDAVDELGPAVRRVLLALGEHSAAEVHRLVQGDLEAITAPAVRRLLVAVAGDLADDEQRPEACRQAVAEIVASSDPAIECLQLANTLGTLGNHTVAAIAERLADAPEPAQVAFVRLLDVLGTRADTPRGTRAEIGRLLLDALRRGRRAARLAVIQSTATMSPGIPARTRAALAAELLATVEEYANPGILDAVEATLARLGAPAVRPLLDALAQADRPRQTACATRVLAALLPRLEPRCTGLAHQAIASALALFESDFPDRDALGRTLGRMCAAPAAPAADVARVAATLRAAILDKAATHGALDGLAHLCLSPVADPSLKVDLADFFVRLLERDLSDIEAVAHGEGDDTVYALDRGVLAYTETVPSIVQGLRHIALGSAGVLRARALDHLLRAWRRVAAGELQLGPGNTGLLLDALHAIGTRPDVEPAQREAIADAVALRRDLFPTYRVLADLYVHAGPAMAQRSAAFAAQLLTLEANSRQLTDTERATLLDALVHLATGADLGHRADPLRERIATIVLEADKRGLEAARPLLDRLLESAAVPAALKSRLATRMAPRE